MLRTLCKTDGHFLKRLNRVTIGPSSSLQFVAKSNGNIHPHTSRNTNAHRGQDSPGTDTTCGGGPGVPQAGPGTEAHLLPRARAVLLTESALPPCET